jgi:hypothetical protein
MSRALADEVRAQRRRPIALPEGVRIDALTGLSGATYSFVMPRLRGVVEGEQMTLVAPFTQSTCGAVIATSGARELVIALRTDLGPTIATGGRLVPREGVPLVVVQELLHDVSAGDREFNADIALRLVGQHDAASRLFRPPNTLVEDVTSSFALLWRGELPGEPNESQQSAVYNLAHLSLSAALGPPGTGKTTTLAAGVEWLLRNQGEGAIGGLRRQRPRILVIAPTNEAVDEAIGRVIDRLALRGRPRAGEVLRVGRNATAAFMERYGEAASLGAVAAQVRIGRTRLAERSAARLDQYRGELEEHRLLESIFPLEMQEERLVNEGRVRRLASLVLRAERVHHRRVQLSAAGVGRPEALEDELFAGCQVLGATAHTALMQPTIREGRWDVVIIDECGALPVALSYALGILARERVWCLGDPRQLAPVVLSESARAHEWLRRDAFSTSHGYQECANGSLDLGSHVVRIGPNRRMHPQIAGLIADAYGGDLPTAPDVARARRLLRAPTFAHVSRKQNGVYLADTSDLGPETEFAPGGSRINRVHLAAVRGLVTLLHEDGLVGPGRGSLAVISPYVAQARRHRTMLTRSFPLTDARAGSAHTWQAREADVVVLDLVEGHGIPVYDWMRASRWSQDGARLLLVSLSRARGRLIVVADVVGLRAQLEPVSPRPLLLSLLDYMEDCGAIDVAGQVRDRTDELRKLRDLTDVAS